MRWRTVSSWRAIVAVFAAGGLLAVCVAEQPADRAATAAAAPPRTAMKEFVSQFCTDCHNGKDKAGELELDAIAADDLSEHAAAWEKVVRKLDSRQMPPLDAQRPKEETYVATLSALETALDAAAAAHPNPGRTPALHRLNRTEYQNAIRDLLALEIDTTDLLPRDEASHGFDNVLPGESVADAAGPLHHGGPKNQPSGGRHFATLRRAATRFAFAPTSRKKNMLRVCRSGPAAAR